MNTKRLYKTLLILLAIVVLVVGISLYFQPGQSRLSILLIVGSAILGAAGFISGVNDTYDLIGKLTKRELPEPDGKQDTISGNVFFHDGLPIQDAEVFIVGAEIVRVTDTNGWFELPINKQDSWELRIKYGAKVVKRRIKLEDITRPLSIRLPKTVESKLRTKSNSLVLRGNVVTIDGTPVNAATVSIDGEKGSYVTDSDGLFQIEVEMKKSWTLRIRYETSVMTKTVSLEQSHKPVIIEFDLVKNDIVDESTKIVDFEIINYEVFHTPEYGNEFPAFDFKLENTNSKTELITRVKIMVEHAEPDNSPSLEYTLGCQNGNLTLMIFNHGWGDAHNLKASIELGSLGVAMGEKTQVVIHLDEIVAGKNVDGRYDPTDAIIINKDEINPDLVLPKYKYDGNWMAGKDIHDFDGETRGGGIEGFRATISFLDVDGNLHEETRTIKREQHGAYDWVSIYLTNDGFQYVPYDPGERYSLVMPSCTYHFVLDHNVFPKEYDISVAHEIPPNGFDRIWLVVGAEQSAKFMLKFIFLTNQKKEIISPPISVHVWNPRNTYFSSAHRHMFSDSSLRKNLDHPVTRSNEWSPNLEKYDIERLKERRNKSWGY